MLVAELFSLTLHPQCEVMCNKKSVCSCWHFSFMYNNRNTNKGEKRQCGDFNVSISDFTASNKKKNRHHLKKRAVSVLKHAKTTTDYIKYGHTHDLVCGLLFWVWERGILTGVINPDLTSEGWMSRRRKLMLHHTIAIYQPQGSHSKMHTLL